VLKCFTLNTVSLIIVAPALTVCYCLFIGDKSQNGVSSITFELWRISK